MNISAATTYRPRLFSVMLLSVLIFSSGGIPLIGGFALTALLLYALAMYCLTLGRSLLTPSTVLAAAVVTALFAVNYLITGMADISPYLYFALQFNLALLVVRYYLNSNHRLAEDMVAALKLFMFHALIAFAIQFVVRGLLFEMDTGSYGAKTFFYLFYYPREVAEYIFLRNQGLFWEPGILQIYMNVLFFLSAFVLRRPRTAMLAAVAVLTTLSTAGLVVLSLQMLVLTWQVARRRPWLVVLQVVAVGLIGMLAYINVMEKVQGAYITSFAARAYDAETAALISLKYPLTGMGLSSERYLDEQQLIAVEADPATGLLAEILVDRGNTNSLLMMPASFGWPVAIMFLYFLYRQKLILQRRWLFLTMVGMVTFSEPLLFTAFFALFMASGLTDLSSRFLIRTGFHDSVETRKTVEAVPTVLYKEEL